jgi:hypothetical protein
MRDRLRTLVLYAQYTTRLSYYDDWLDAFRADPALAVVAINIAARGSRAAVARQIAEFDLVVLLHSTNADTLTYIDPFRDALSARRGKLVAFVGNELNTPGSPLAARIAHLRAIGADYIATQLLPETGAWLYAEVESAQVISVPHALNPAVFRATTPAAARPIDIGTRSARYIAYLGDDDRNRLFALFETHRFDPALTVDISTDERLDRAGWCAFLNRCKGTIANEAGGFFLERDDRTMDAIRAYVLAKERARGGVVIANDSPLRRFGHRLPWFVKEPLRRLLRGGLVRHEMLINEDLSFDEIYERFYRGRPRPPFHAKAISSRHFDAIGTRTCQILLEGRYNDILVPGVHYLALKSDFSNVADVMAEFRDPERRQAITTAAYDLAMAAHTHRHRIAMIRDRVSAAA